jgi:transcription-repair coupling factor (superfamily II helicase)
VQTFVMEQDNALRSLPARTARGGQVYFLHNDVETIEHARELSELVPEARIGIAHGQMPSASWKGDAATSTTALQRAAVDHDHRTGHRHPQRQHHHHQPRRPLRPGPAAPAARPRRPFAPPAYAYLVAPTAAITPDAEKRLEAIASMDELGAGFTLATHDLEIRGAGELLGEDQSGQMAEVGFSLYTELLERAVRSIKQGKLPDLDAGEEVRGAEVKLHVPALIPEDYLPDVHTRLTLYKRISSARDSDALRSCRWR